MTMFRPNIRIDRMAVFGRGSSLYDERFHNGLNIIRGENSSGKSTIMDFLFYSLGGDLFDWREISTSCDSVYVQTSLNGNAVTLCREVSTQSMRPMRIFLGEMDAALVSASAGWEIYPYSRGSRDSFSQVLFRLLGLPEVQTGESQTKITMNQILRLMYSDQLSPIEKLFRLQQFDDAVTRQTVGDLLCGAYSDAYYQAVLEKNRADKQIDSVISSIRTMVTTHARGDMQLNRVWLQSERTRLSKELEKRVEEIDKIEAKIFSVRFEDGLSLDDQQYKMNELLKSQEELASIDREIQRTDLEIADSIEFIEALKSRLQQLRQSDVVIEEFGRLDFQFCPSCLEPIEGQDVEGACRLCKAPYDKSRVRSRSLKFINEFTRQVEQSAMLQREREEKLRVLQANRAGVMERWQQLNAAYKVSVRTPTTKMRAQLRSLNREVGAISKEIEGLASKSEIIAQFEALTKQRDELQRQLDQLSATIYTELKRMRERKSTSQRHVEALAIEFLKKDLSRQNTFAHADRVDFEFDGNRMSVNGDSYFSASSMVYLKNSVLAALMFAAARDPRFSHPRLLLLDTIEDKGMEPERSKNFQLLLREMSASTASEHQIIVATSMIAEELNSSDYTVGEYYTHTHRTLRAPLAGSGS